jgi:predicted porin
MRKILGGALALSLTATSAFAGVSTGNADSNWTIYGWQNWSYEMVDDDNRDFSRINNNAANIGFAASIDTGMSDMKVNMQCEQFTFHNRFNGASDFCNRNSKISLSGSFGEIMFGQWLLPYNEMVAQWVDPFYDAGADSHTSIMGNIGGNGNFYNGSGFGDNNSFNRRQEEIVQYFSPDFNGFKFRIATTNANRNGAGEEQTAILNDLTTTENDPRIWSMGASYDSTMANGDSIWLAVTHERHDEWAAVDFACADSDDKAYRIAGRYIHNMADGAFIKVAGMWETLEYEWDECGNGLAANVPGANAGASTKAGGLVAAGGSIEVERDAFMLSAVVGFGNGFDVRASYMDADELEVDGSDQNDTDAKAYNLGVYYTMPAGTELRATYSKVDNESASGYDFGIGGTNAEVGDDVEMIAVGIVQWF